MSSAAWEDGSRTPPDFNAPRRGPDLRNCREHLARAAPPFESTSSVLDHVAASIRERRRVPSAECHPLIGREGVKEFV